MEKEKNLEKEKEKALDVFKSYINEMSKINVYEEIEDGSHIEQCKYFMNLLISRPQIDGDHSDPTPLIDARNCLAMASKETILVMDDTNLINGWAGVLQAMCELIKNKEIDTSRVVCEQFGRNAWTLFFKAPTNQA